MDWKIVTRQQWGATAPQGGPMPLPSKGVWLHHSVTARTADSRADMRAVERIGVQRFGRFSYSWAYHAGKRQFLEGAGNTQGAHTKGQNSTTHAIVLIGNFDNDKLPDEAVADIAGFITHGASQKWWKPVLLGGHCDTGAATACPGSNARERITDIRAALDKGTPDTTPDTTGKGINDMYPVLKIENDTRLWLATPNGVRQVPRPAVLTELRSDGLAAKEEREISLDAFRVVAGFDPSA